MLVWGAGGCGQLGNANTDDAILSPTNVPLFDFDEIIGGGSHTIFHEENESKIIICGNNDNHQLSPSENKQFVVPEKVELKINIQSLFLGWVRKWIQDSSIKIKV